MIKLYKTRLEFRLATKIIIAQFIAFIIVGVVLFSLTPNYRALIFYSIVSTLILSISFVLIYRFAIRSLIQRIANLTTHIQDIQAGNYSSHINSDKIDEFGLLESSFNNMAMELKEKEEKLQLAFKQINQNILSISELVDRIRNPLSVILGIVELQENMPDTDKIIKQINEIESVVKKLDTAWEASEIIKEYLQNTGN